MRGIQIRNRSPYSFQTWKRLIEKGYFSAHTLLIEPFVCACACFRERTFVYRVLAFCTLRQEPDGHFVLFVYTSSVSNNFSKKPSDFYTL